MKPTRRQVLAAAAAVSAAGGLGLGTSVWSWWDRPAGAGLKALAPEEHAFVQAMAEAWMPPGGTPAISGAEARLGDYFDDMVASMPADLGKQLRLLLHALDHLTVPVRGRTFRSLPLETRSAVLAGWLDHPVFLVRDGVTAVMILIGMGYTTHPEVVSVLRPMFPCGYGR